VSTDIGSFLWTSASAPTRAASAKSTRTPVWTSRARALGCCRRHGGHSLGEFASGLAVQSLKNLPCAERLEERVSVALDRLREANRYLRAEALRREVPLIGTTIAALVAAGNLCSCSGPATAVSISIVTGA